MNDWMIRRCTIGPVEISDIGYDGILNTIRDSVHLRRRCIVLYAGAHHVTRCETDETLSSAFTVADIVHPDGIGVWAASRWLCPDRPLPRFNWSDETLRFLSECVRNRWRLFFLGSTDDVLRSMRIELNRKYPDLQLAGIANGFHDASSATCIERINAAEPDILWVGMGTPAQEYWIKQHHANLHVPVIQSVGDAFAIIAGTKVRGPKFIQKAGLEWLVRLLRHPIRFFSRYVFGIPLFMMLIIRQKFGMSNSGKGA